jgi:hypothetical protein
MPKLVVVERDYPAVAADPPSVRSWRPGRHDEGVTYEVSEEVDYLRRRTAPCVAVRPTAIARRDIDALR